MNSSPAAALPNNFTTEDSSRPVHPMRVRHFRNLWIGSMISLGGDQFYLVALPWLVLQLSGSSLALGTIMMTAAVPRAVLMLVGGAISDRFSSRRVLMCTATSRAILVGAIAFLAWQGVIHIWHIYALALMFGVADAFAFPAGAALMPTLVERQQLAAANSVFQGSAQVVTMLAPAPAGLIVKRFGTPIAFFADALSFVAVIFALIGLPDRPRAAALPGVPKPKLLSSIKDGLSYVKTDVPLRYLLLLSAALNFCLGGPISVGLATLAKFHFGSSAAFGTLVSCVSAGALAGMLAAGVIKRKTNRGYLLATLTLVIAVCLIAIAAAPKFAVVAGALVCMGAASGFTNVQLVAWMQARVAREMLGRVMSVLMFAAVGLMPLSFAAAGAVAQLHLSAMFYASGALVLFIGAAFVLSGAAREMQ